MAVRFRVQCLRADHHAPGLVGDFEDLEQARDAARSVKSSRPGDAVSIQAGQDTPWHEQPPERRHPNGQHFLAGDEPAEVI